MSFRLKPKEKAICGVRRLVLEQLQESIALLTDAGGDRHASVHEARKRFKKIRAILRLVRPRLGNHYAGENVFYRDTARLLAEARDAQALIESFDSLASFYGETVFGRFAGIRARLIEERDRIVSQSCGLEDNVQQVVQRLHEAMLRVDHWPLKGKGFSLVREGLQRNYAEGRKAFRIACATPTNEHFHEWRKHVKYLWHHARILENVWPAMMRTLQRELKRLSDLLGDDHDLAVMHATVDGARSGEFGDVETVDAFLKLVTESQRSLRRKSRRLGLWIFSEKPKAFTTRIGGWWAVSRLSNE